MAFEGRLFEFVFLMKKYRKNNDGGLKSRKKYAIFRTNEHRNSSQKCGAGCLDPFFEVKMSRIGSRTTVMQERPPEGGDFHIPIISASLKLNLLWFYGAYPPVFRRKRHIFFGKIVRKHPKKTETSCLHPTGREHPFTTCRNAQPTGMIHSAHGRCLLFAGTGGMPDTRQQQPIQHKTKKQ